VTLSVRRGGRSRTLDGATITWTQAEGARGTRWRESIVSERWLTRSVLLEVSAAGRPTRLEVTTTAGLLTLHPETDESAIHGNVVGSDGVRHLAFDWSPAHELLLLSSPASAAVTLGRLASELAVGETRTLDVLRIDDGLDPRPARWNAKRTDERGWHLRSLDDAEERIVSLDASGRPVLPDAVEWPLEE
jgi:hypothetical protein